MGSIFLAMVARTWVSEALLYAGLVAALLATAVYVRTGRAEAGRAVQNLQP
jgi:hypothetical protein